MVTECLTTSLPVMTPRICCLLPEGRGGRRKLTAPDRGQIRTGSRSIRQEVAMNAGTRTKDTQAAVTALTRARKRAAFLATIRQASQVDLPRQPQTTQPARR